MATVTPTIVWVDPNTVKFTWEALTTTNADGAPIGKRFSDYSDRSVQVEGTFGAGGSITWQGSNNGGTNYQPVTDPQGNAITKTAAGMEQVTEITQLQRPFVSAGDGTTSLTVTVIARRGRGSEA